MGKLYKPGKVVIVLNGKYTGKKGIIIKSNYESAKDRKFPFCIVAGLSRGPRKPTKRNIAKIKYQISELQKKEDTQERINKLKSFGVFIKTYNMSHLLATRYKIKEDIGVIKSLEKLEKLGKTVKDEKIELDTKQKNKKALENEKAKKEIEESKNKYGKSLEEYKKEFKNTKVKIGEEMYKRFMKGFIEGKDDKDKENQENTHYFFKKLHF